MDALNKMSCHMHEVAEQIKQVEASIITNAFSSPLTNNQEIHHKI